MAKQPKPAFGVVAIDLEVLATLRKASADRKNQDRKPNTQKAIVAEALSAWFKKNGYAD